MGGGRTIALHGFKEGVVHEIVRKVLLGIKQLPPSLLLLTL